MSARRSSRRAAVVSTLASNSIASMPAQIPPPAPPVVSPAATPSTPTNKTPTEIVKETTFANCPLYMDCEDDPLTNAQKQFHSKRVKLFQEQMVKLESLAKQGARIQPQKDGNVVFRNTETTTSAPVPLQSGNMTPQMQHPNMQNPGIRLLMDPKTGRILGTINGNSPMQQGMPQQPQLVRSNQPGLRMPGAQQMLSRAPAPPTLTPVSRMTPTRPLVSPAAVDLARSHGGGPAQQQGSATSASRNKTFPALQMQPKPQKALPASNSRRPELDAKVKSLLVHTPAKFTEWLIQHGLVAAEQFEVLPGIGKSKLKLGMYSDAKKFPNSGGYVWISDANANKFISVFRGSIFEASNHEPIVVLKLIYHWSCQTNIQNVLTWVKVDHATIDLYYRLFRAVCTATVHDELVNLGGPGKAVEIGVISLGTSSSDGNKREVRVEVLGVLDRASGLIRLRATEPIAGANQVERFNRIFENINVWVQRSTKICTDYSVDKERLNKLGYSNVVQTSSSRSKRSENSNATIMEYLKGVVPKMFQNSLSHLTTPAIQQFLDELTFRESYGNYPLLCFDSLIQKIATRTIAVATTATPLFSRLQSISEDPFQDWRINVASADQNVPDTLASGSSSGTKRPAESEADIDQMINKKFKVASELVDLESYFYATLQGDMEVLSSEFKADMAFKCHLCKKVYMNNIEFMKHLSLHVETDRASAVDLADLCQCKYCYKEFETPYAMQSHLEEIHLKKGSEFLCRICDEGFHVKNHLIHHMSKTHLRAEMPYLCQICGYRSSTHRDLIDHFQEIHDRTDKLQCPKCLKTYSLFSDKGYNSSVASSFVTHLQQHLDKKVSCKKCCLIFHNDQALKAHNEKDHVSFKSFDNIEMYQYPSGDEPIKMPKPDERNSRTAAKKSGLVKAPQQQSAFAAQNLEDVVMYDVENQDNCGECGKKFNMPGHYTAYLCCTKCRYSTCCSKAISVHVAIFHGTVANPVYNLGAPINLESEVFCCCGFKSNSGNKMAKHLATHGCKSAYSDAESASKAIRAISSASFAPLVSLDEGESVDPSVAMAKAYCKQKDGKKEDEKKTDEGPLAFLGLQRKSVDEEDDENKAETEEKNKDTEGSKDETEKKDKDSEESKDETEKKDNEESAEKKDKDTEEVKDKTENKDKENEAEIDHKEPIENTHEVTEETKEDEKVDGNDTTEKTETQTDKKETTDAETNENKSETEMKEIDTMEQSNDCEKEKMDTEDVEITEKQESETHSSEKEKEKETDEKMEIEEEETLDKNDDNNSAEIEEEKTEEKKDEEDMTDKGIDDIAIPTEDTITPSSIQETENAPKEPAADQKDEQDSAAIVPAADPEDEQDSAALVPAADPEDEPSSAALLPAASESISGVEQESSLTVTEPTTTEPPADDQDLNPELPMDVDQ